MQNNSKKIMSYIMFICIEIVTFPSSIIKIKLINISLFGCFTLNLTMDMHGSKFGIPSIKDQDPQVVHDASDMIH